ESGSRKTRPQPSPICRVRSSHRDPPKQSRLDGSTDCGRDRDRTTNPPIPTVPASERFQQLIEESNKRTAETREKILAILTPEQKAKWSEMTGETFKFPSPQRSAARGTSTRSSEPAKPGAEKEDQ